MVSVRIENRSPHPLPQYQTAGAAGMDLCAWLPGGAVTLPPLGRLGIPTGLFLALPEGFEGQVRPRSGLSLRRGLTVINSPGTIDCDYRGEIIIPMVNLGDAPQTIADGDRIAQLIVARYERIAWTEMLVEANDTGRGAGGFGSTGG